MMNSHSSVPDLSYNTNRVLVDGNLRAQAAAGGAVASGFVTSTGQDSNNTPDHIWGNSVRVGGSIEAVSDGAEAAATGYGYLNRTHRRDCSVWVGGGITAYSRCRRLPPAQRPAVCRAELFCSKMHRRV